MIPDNIVQEIKDRADIVEVVEQFFGLKRKGANRVALCPFHNERTPSFNVNPARNIFKCFGCDKGGDSIEFLMEHEDLTYPDALKWLAGFYNISIKENENENTTTYKTQQRRAAPIAPPKPPPSFTDPAKFQASLTKYETNNLVQWLCKKLGHDVVMEAVTAYHVGTAKDGGTIFWLTNIDGQVGTGHIMYYPKNDHHRIQSKNPNWTNFIAGQTDTEKYNWVKYWFGEHLLKIHPLRTVAIVESEKTALVCSIYFAHLGYVWIASGGIGLGAKDWNVLKGRKVILYPDLGPPTALKKGGKELTPFDRWEEKSEQMQGFGIYASVNKHLEKEAAQFTKDKKWDLADFLLKCDLLEVQHAVPTSEPPDQRIEQTPQPETTTVPGNTPPTPPQTPQAILNPNDHLPDGHHCERYTDRMTGKKFEVMINADGYPATWNLNADQKKTLTRFIKAAPPITNLITHFDLRLVGVDPITDESETAFGKTRERAAATCRRAKDWRPTITNKYKIKAKHYV